MNMVGQKGSKVVTYAGRILLGAIIIFGCKSDLSDDAIPFVAFADLVVNLSAPEFQPLAVNGGFKDIGSIGVRGVIVYRRDAATYLAFERNCSYHPNEACATVNVHSTNLYMVDPCCNSTFSFTDGTPSGGIAWRPLRIYATSLTGTQLTITDEIAN